MWLLVLMTPVAPFQHKTSFTTLDIEIHQMNWHHASLLTAAQTVPISKGAERFQECETTDDAGASNQPILRKSS